MNQENPIYSPKTPYVRVIEGGLKVDRAIVVKGLVLNNDGEKRFCINLSAGLLVDGNSLDNVVLHVNPRFVQNTVVLNTLINNRWGPEEVYENPLKLGQAFEIRILPQANFYSIFMNGRHLADYVHRIPLSNVKTLFIKGNVRIDYIEFETCGAPSFVPYYKPPVPFCVKVNAMVAGRQFYIVGTPRFNADRFVVNFKIKNEIAFHISVRLRESAVVRNTLRYDLWQHEERSVSYMPFKAGSQFQMQILCDHSNFKVAVNGQHFFGYDHRMNYEDIDRFEIDGDIDLQQVVV